MRKSISVALVSLLALATIGHGAVAEAAPRPVQPAAVTKGLPGQQHLGGTKRVLSGGYTYAGGRQTLAAGTVADGASATLEVVKPYVEPVAGNHSLAEIAVQDSSTINNVVEIGWTADNALNGDYDPHLFGFTWAGGVGQGYNSLNPYWVDEPSNSVNLGASLSSVVTATWPNNAKSFVIQRVPTQTCGSTPGVYGWWLFYAGSAVGCFKDTAWASTGGLSASQARVFQFFGEVYDSAKTTPCTDAGNGKGATSYVSPLDATDPAYIGSAGITGTSPATDTNLSLFATDATKYSAVRVSTSGTPLRTFVYGGPGWNAAGTATGSTGSC
jgi:hypothetical protein